MQPDDPLFAQNRVKRPKRIIILFTVEVTVPHYAGMCMVIITTALSRNAYMAINTRDFFLQCRKRVFFFVFLMTLNM